MSRRTSSDGSSAQTRRVVIAGSAARSRAQSQLELSRPADIQTSQLPGHAFIDNTLFTSTPPRTSSSTRSGGLASAGRSSSGVTPSSAPAVHPSPTVSPSPGLQQPAVPKRKETPDSDSQGHERKRSRPPTAAGTPLSPVKFAIQEAAEPPTEPAAAAAVTKATAVRNPPYSDSKAHKIPRSELQIGELIGHGGSGDVLRGTWTHQSGRAGVEVSESVAVKEIKSAKGAAEQQLILEREVAHLQQHRGSQYVVQILGVSVDENIPVRNRHCFVMERAAHGSLATYLEARVQPGAISLLGPLALLERLALCLQCVEAVSYLHSHSPPILHRDIKPHNFLVFDRINGGGVQVKISDFDLAQARSQSATASSIHGHAGTTNYIAPEVAAGRCKPSPQADIFAIGVLMWVVCTGQSTQNGNLQRAKMPGLPPRLCTLIERCWATDWKQRPDCKSVRDELQQIISEVVVLGVSAVSIGDSASALPVSSTVTSDLSTTASVTHAMSTTSLSSAPPDEMLQSSIATADAAALLALGAAQTVRGIQAGVQGVQAVVGRFSAFGFNLR